MLNSNPHGHVAVSNGVFSGVWHVLSAWHPGIKRILKYYLIRTSLQESTHAPNHRQKTINYYGWYSNKSRGLRKTQNIPELEIEDASQRQSVYCLFTRKRFDFGGNRIHFP